MATIASSGTGLASTRYCQPALSSRLVSTWTKPVSESSTASRIGGWPVAAVRRSGPSRAAVWDVISAAAYALDAAEPESGANR